MKSVLTQIFEEAYGLDLKQRTALLAKIRNAKAKAGLPTGNAFKRPNRFKKLNTYA